MSLRPTNLHHSPTINPAMIAVGNTTISDVGTDLLVGYILSLIPLVILYYDYLISLPDEVEYFWLWRQNELDRDGSTQPLPGSHHKQTRWLGLPRRLDWVSYLCLVNRYVSIIGHIPVMKSYLVMGDLALPPAMGIPSVLRDHPPNAGCAYAAY
ncbi:hypothetical protein BC834DRAFT_337207 [Gloeopeniophorella convolvens]|nr:hypothetical protein BC834DRAFT_337207 [Gloeopeniophorella convolvens]